MHLSLEPDDLNKCVHCGLCLPHCPTYRVTGDETLSPRGRITLMREVQHNGAPLTREVMRSFETCVQCRGCESACPSGVPFGHLIEQTRTSLVSKHRASSRWLRVAYLPLVRPRLLRAVTVLLAVAQRFRLVPRRLALPARLPMRRAAHHRSGSDVYLFTGCVMDAWQREVHLAAQRVIEAAGFGVTPTGDLAPCCGALHSHAGLTRATLEAASGMIAALAGARPILVDSAGCGAQMKDYGRLLGTDAARDFSARVFDIQEWLALQLEELPEVQPLDLRVAIQDPCHLRHVQGVHQQTREVLKPFVTDLLEIDDEGLCCGAGGAFSVLHPDLAGPIGDRKVSAIDRLSPDVVASANPGCSLHLAAKGVPTRHPMQLIDDALSGGRVADPQKRS